MAHKKNKEYGKRKRGEDRPKAKRVEEEEGSPVNAAGRQVKKVKKKAGQDQKKQLSPMEVLKMEVAAELGLLDKVKKLGWGGLSARESGQVGGYMTKRLKEEGKI